MGRGRSGRGDSGVRIRPLLPHPTTGTGGDREESPAGQSHGTRLGWGVQESLEGR